MSFAELLFVGAALEALNRRGGLFTRPFLPDPVLRFFRWCPKDL